MGAERMWRRRGLAASVIAVAAAGALLAGASGAEAAARSLTTENWAGYAVRGQTMDAVVLEFLVPAVTCTADNQALSIWAGFGGLTERSLVQGGVQVRCRGTEPHYTLFEQRTTGSGASTVGPEVSPGDYVRVVVCPSPGTAPTGRCSTGAPANANYMTSVAYKKGATGDYRVWSESLVPQAWSNTRTEASCIAERPRDATTEELLDVPAFTMPAVRCQPYRSVNPVGRVDIANGGDGFAAYRLSLTTPGRDGAGRTIAPRGVEPPRDDGGGTATSPTADGDPTDNPQVPSPGVSSDRLPIGDGPVVLVG